VNGSRSSLLAAVLLAPGLATAYDLNDEWSLGGVLAAAGQCQQIAGEAVPSACRGAMPLQPEISFHPNEANEFAVKLGFAAGNALGPVSPFSVPVWAADLEDDVRHVNGSGRSHLLTAWDPRDSRRASSTAPTSWTTTPSPMTSTHSS
jgi:hypothetical protein